MSEGSTGFGWGNVRQQVEHGIPGAILRGQERPPKPPVERRPVRRSPLEQAPASSMAVEAPPSNGNGHALDALALLRLEGARALCAALGVETTETDLEAMAAAVKAHVKPASQPPSNLGTQLVGMAIESLDELRETLAGYIARPTGDGDEGE